MKVLTLSMIMIATISCIGCSGTSFTTGIGYDWNEDHLGRNPVAIFSLDQEIMENVTCGWLHVSNIRDGIPFNHNKENTADIANCKYTYRFGE